MKKEKSMSILGLNMLGSDITKPEKELRSLKRGEQRWLPNFFLTALSNCS
jgi:hypothetical protein